jgi:hypothetical protein
MMKKNCQFNARSKYWKYWSGRSIEFIFPKDLGNIKREVQVSNGRYGPYIRHGAACVLPKGENPLDIDFERAKELIDEQLLMHLLHFIKGRVFRKVLAVLVLL